MKYSALQVTEKSDGEFVADICELDTDNLPAGDVLIRVSYSSLNYKDALSFSGNKGVTRHYPHTPGIDAVGQVVSSDSDAFSEGQSVVVVGYDLGMNTAGGLGEYIRVPANWVMPLNAGMSERQSMAWGTAGFTAALCVEKLLNSDVLPKNGPVLVSGATGGVGSIAVQLLKKLGFTVHALTTKDSASEFLKGIGADEIILLSEFDTTNKRPMLKPQYAAAIDVAGGNLLASILKVVNYGGAVACCGLVESVALNTTVLPFILRGVDLLGVDSVELPLAKKQQVWSAMSGGWSLDRLEDHCEEISKAQLSEKLSLILNGQAKGRFILDHSL